MASNFSSETSRLNQAPCIDRPKNRRTPSLELWTRPFLTQHRRIFQQLSTTCHSKLTGLGQICPLVVLFNLLNTFLVHPRYLSPAASTSSFPHHICRLERSAWWALFCLQKSEFCWTIGIGIPPKMASEKATVSALDSETQATRRRNVPSTSPNGGLVNRVEIDDKKTQVNKVRLQGCPYPRYVALLGWYNWQFCL